MVSCLICAVYASRRRGTSLRSEIANEEDPYTVRSCRHLIENQDEEKYLNLGSMLFFSQ